MYTYNATVVRWVDGDTVILDVDLGFFVSTRQHFRLIDVDTPERGELNYDAARLCAQEVCPVGSQLEILTAKTEKYGRWLVSIPQVAEALLLRNLLKVK